MLQAKTLNVIFYKTISLQGIFDWARQHIKPLNNYNFFEMIMEDAEYEWAKNTYGFLKYNHPEKLQAFMEARARLGVSQDKEWWSFLQAPQCSGYRRCNETVCPICQLNLEEEAAALTG